MTAEVDADQGARGLEHSRGRSAKRRRAIQIAGQPLAAPLKLLRLTFRNHLQRVFDIDDAGRAPRNRDGLVMFDRALDTA